MAGFSTGNTGHLIRSQVWSQNLKDVLTDELQATKYVDWLSEFPDGDTFNIPSIGEAALRNYAEGDAIAYDAMDTGNFQFSITEYKSSATYITKKAMQDGFYMDRLVASFVPKQSRAIQEGVETDIMALADSVPLAGTSSINGVAHRWAGAGTTGVAARGMQVSDFAKAQHALKKANVSQENLVAIVDPSVEYSMNLTTNITNVSNNPRWEGIVSDGIASGMRFVKNIYGFDVYTSNYTSSGRVVTAGDKQNLFFSASSDVLPFVGAWRQMPEVDSEYNKDKQRDEYVTTARYGVKLYRPENLVVVETNPVIV